MESKKGSEAMDFYLGVDGGGTKTRAAVCDAHGNIIRSVWGKTINYYSNPYETARRNFREIIDKTGITSYKSVCIGMSALSERADSETAHKFTDGILDAEKLIMTSDVEIALNAADCNTARAVLICGTGSMAAAYDADGSIVHCGGWGYLLGDEGSGYSVALNAVKKIIRQIDDGKTDDILINRFRDFFGVYSDEDILGCFYEPPIERDRLASFCRCVFEAMHEGSVIAAETVSHEADEAADLAKRILARLPDNSPLYLYGGLFENSVGYVDMLNNRAGVRASVLPYPPVAGALADAVRNDGIITDEEFFLNLGRGMNE